MIAGNRQTVRRMHPIIQKVVARTCAMALLILTLPLSGLPVAAADETLVDDKQIRMEFQKRIARANVGDANAKFAVFAHVWRYANRFETDDLREAADYLIAAAKDGHTEAQYNLGYMMFTGTWFDEDKKGAIPWLALAANDGYPSAQYWAGIAFRMEARQLTDEQEVANYHRAAIRWLRQAVEAGIDDARFYLGDALVYFPEHLNEGIQYLREAANDGHELAKEQLPLALELAEQLEQLEDAAREELQNGNKG